MTLPVLAIVFALIPTAPAAAGPQEDWIVSVFTSTNTPPEVRRALEYQVRVMMLRRELVPQTEGQTSLQPSAAIVNVSPAVPAATPATAANDFKLRTIYAFPNPAVANQKPTIHVSVGVADKVTFRFFDISGQQVHDAAIDSPPSQIDDGAGIHPAYEYSWEGRIPSGVYLYSVTAEKAGQPPIRQVGKFAVVR